MEITKKIIVILIIISFSFIILFSIFYLICDFISDIFKIEIKIFKKKIENNKTENIEKVNNIENIEPKENKELEKIFYPKVFNKTNEELKINKVDINISEISFNVAGSFLEYIQEEIYSYFYNRFNENELFYGLTDSIIKEKGIIDKKIYKFPQGYKIKSNYTDEVIKFQKEENNIYDKNAINITIKKIGFVGYVPKKINIELKKILDNKIIKEVDAVITGGNYKILRNTNVIEFNRKLNIKIIIKYLEK